jgi:glycosyltransferase involved in cell wall biosynthesis
MRIGFDARMIDHPGIGRYIRNLLNAMRHLDKSLEFILFGDPEKLLDFKDFAIKEYRASIYHFREFFSSAIDGKDFEVVHIPHFNVPYFKIKNLVVTIHDLIYLKFPESHSHFVPGIAIKLAISNAIKKTKKIIAVSENTKKDIIENFPDIDQSKIKVIYEAADPIFRKIDDPILSERIRKIYILPRDYILFVGSLKWHKNINLLIDAHSDLKSKGVEHKLVITGRYRPREAEVSEKIKSSDVIYLGEVPAEDLVGIYNLATLLIIPSLYEGFCLPALEAMACGIPVAASNVASLPEVIGNAGVFFNPYDRSAISDAIYKILMNQDLRKELIRKGLARVNEFSWEKTARETLNIYTQVAQQNN